MRNRLLEALLFTALVSTFSFAQSAAQPGFTPNPSAKPADAYKDTLDKLQSITDVPLNDWRSHEADLPHGEDVAIDDAQWKTAKLNDEWKSGGQWLRRTIEVPAEINGYDVRGARIDLDVAVTSDQAIQISTFANGSLIGRTDEDTQLPITLTNDAQPGQKFVIAVRVVGAPVTTKMYRAHLTIRANAKRPDPALLRLEILSIRPVIDAYDADRKSTRLNSSHT